MPRSARIVVPGLPHHITQRGNRKQAVFFREEDREVYLSLLADNRFFSAPLDAIYRWRALRYVELNPVRAGLVAAPEDYPWSSAAVHLGLRAAPAWLDLPEWAACWTPETWRAYLNERLDAAADLATIRDQTYLGRPLGSPTFI